MSDTVESSILEPHPLGAAHEHAHAFHEAVVEGLHRLSALVDRDAQAVYRVAKEVATALDLHADADPAQQPKLVVALHNVLLTLARYIPVVAEKAVLVEMAAEVVEHAAAAVDAAIESSTDAHGTLKSIAAAIQKPAKAKKPRKPKAPKKLK